jgi:hypothetical protein
MTSSHVTKPDGEPRDVQQLAAQLEADLLARHGPMVGGTELHRALGYPSATAFRTALNRDQVPIQVFNIEYRRGKFALTKHVAAWLANQLGDASQPKVKT